MPSILGPRTRTKSTFRAFHLPVRNDLSGPLPSLRHGRRIFRRPPQPYEEESRFGRLWFWFSPLLGPLIVLAFAYWLLAR